ncbi:hypothetical protein BDW69DRAFT_179407 [Aspergillus filifer]
MSRTKPGSIPEGVEVLDLTLSSPSPSPSPQRSTQIFASPPSKGRFSHYTGKAEEYRQSSITRTRNLQPNKAQRVPVHFHLAKQKQIDDVPQVVSCQLLKSTCAYIYPVSIVSYKHFIEVYLLKELNLYKLQESDTLHLAYNIQGINPVYLPDSYDKPQSSSDILQHFEIKKGIFVIILQAATELPPVPEDNKPKRKKRITKSKSFVQEPEVKLEPGIKLELEEPEVVRDLLAEPVVEEALFLYCIAR